MNEPLIAIVYGSSVLLFTPDEITKARRRGNELVPPEEPAREADRKAEPLIDSEQMAKRLGVPKSQVESLARKGVIPSVAVGGRYVRFDEQAVRKALQAETERKAQPRASAPRPPMRHATRRPPTDSGSVASGKRQGPQ